MTIPRYSREDHSRQLSTLLVAIRDAEEMGLEGAYLDLTSMKVLAAILSEATPRAPTHQQLIRRGPC